MPLLSPAARQVTAAPGAFLWRAVRGFLASQGLLLAGAVAYYALLSVVPLLILAVIGLSHFVDPHELFEVLGRYLEWLLPGQSAAVLSELRGFVAHRDVLGWVLGVTLVFFSSLGFAVLEKAMAVIFTHRFRVRHRHFMVSALLPYCFVLCLSAGLLVVTVVAGGLEALGAERVRLLGRAWSLQGVSGALLYLLGFVGEVVLLTALYIVMPVGRLTWRHALPGAITAAVLWEITRHVLVWYFATLSQVSIVYGSLTTAIVVLLSLEIGATLLLFGAQVISEYERLALDEKPQAP